MNSSIVLCTLEMAYKYLLIRKRKNNILILPNNENILKIISNVFIFYFVANISEIILFMIYK